MSEKIIDIASQSSIDSININAITDISPTILMGNTTIQNMTEIGGVPSSTESCAMIEYNGMIFVIPDGGESVYKLTNDKECWEWLFDSPVPNDTTNTRFLIFEDPYTNNVELHFIGGKDRFSLTHFRHSLNNSEGMSIASELPFKFQNGRAIVYRDEIHIFGTSGEHFKFNGIGWEEASIISFDITRFTPFVYNSSLYLIGETKICRFDTISKIWEESELNISEDILNASIVTTDSNPIILGGDNDTAIKLNMNSDLDSITIEEVTLPDGKCINSQGAAYANNKVYINMGSHIYMTDKTIGGGWVKYKSTSLSMDNAVVFHRCNSAGVESVVIGTIGTKKLIDIDTETTETIEHLVPYHVATNSVGDIYMFLSPVDENNTNIQVYEKNPDGGYILRGGVEPELNLDTYEVIWFDNKFHIITNGEYNHYTYGGYGSADGVDTPAVFTGKLNPSSRLNSICEYDNKIYVVSENDGNIILSVFNKAYWSNAISSNIEGDIKDIELINYNGNLNLFILTSDLSGARLKHYLCADKFLLLNDTASEWQSMKAIVSDDGIDLFGTNASGATDRVLYESGVSGYSECEIITINLDKGRSILCNKKRVFPITNNVYVTKNGYLTMGAGIYKFAIFNKEEKVPFTLT